MKTIRLCLLIFCLSCLLGCSQVDVGNTIKSDRSTHSNLAETVAPKVIRELNQQLDVYNPQVRIVSPRQNQTFKETNIEIQLAVDDFPIFQDEKLKLGNHLNLILDNEPVRPIYDLTKPVVFQELTPGTHTIRVFADRPWGESYKNEGAYAQTTFNVLTETNSNHPDPSLPLLTYNNPIGTYSAEPILLDFYLTNAPLHSVAENNPNVADWQIKATVNGESFRLENWQPVYLKGFNRGDNWIQLELIDEAGNDIANVYNNTVRVINYNPETTDTLGKLMSDRISTAEAQPIVEQTYYIQPVGKPEIIEPSVEVAPETEPPVTKENENTEAIAPLEEPAVIEEDNQLETDTESAVKTENVPVVIAPSNPTQTPVTPLVEAVEEPAEIDQELKEDRAIAPTEKIETEVIAISEENLNTDSTTPVAEIEIPKPESVEITEDEIKITVPSLESNETTETTEAPKWWKKLLVGLRQKLEGLVKRLPSEA